MVKHMQTHCRKTVFLWSLRIWIFCSSQIWSFTYILTLERDHSLVNFVGLDLCRSQVWWGTCEDSLMRNHIHVNFLGHHFLQSHLLRYMLTHWTLIEVLVSCLYTHWRNNISLWCLRIWIFRQISFVAWCEYTMYRNVILVHIYFQH